MNRSFIPDTELISREKFLNALAETYLLQDAILNSTEFSVISTTEDGTINSFNPAAEYMLGYQHSELIGKWSPMLLHDYDEILARANELSLELGRPVEPNFEVFTAKLTKEKSADRREWTYIRKDGTRFPVMLSLSGIWNERGEITGYLGIASDITEQKKNDERIKKSEAHLQVLLNSIDDIAVEINRDFVYTNIWTKNEHLLYAKRNEYLGHSIYDILKGPMAHVLKPYEVSIAKVFATREPEYLEYEVPGPTPWRSGKVSYINESTVLVLVRDISARKLAEKNILESEQRFRLLAENIPGVIYLCQNDVEYSMVYLNEQVEKVTGYKAQDFLNNSISFVQLYHPDDKEGIFTAVDNALAEKKNFQIEYRLRHKEGHWIWIEEYGAGVYRNDELIMLEGFLYDVTSKKLDEQEILKISEENNRVFNYSISLNAVAGFDGHFKKNNPEWERAFGYTLEELQSRPFIELVHPEDINATLGASNLLMQGQDLATFENRYRCKDGSYRWLLWTSSVDMKLQLIYASAIDITEWKKTSEQVDRMKDENRYIFENAITLSIIADEQGRFKKVNPTIEQVLGWTEEEFVGKTALDFVHPDSMAHTREAMKMQSRGASLPTLENQFRCKDGSYRWLLWSSYADRSRKLLYGTAIDITERKQAEENLALSKANLESAAEELQEQNKQLNEFAHIISHNLRSPVGNINALISLLDENSPIEAYREIFTRLKLTSENLTDTLNDLMETLHVKKEASAQRTIQVFEDALNKVKQDLSGEILQSNALITSELQVAEVLYSKTYLESILLNLLSNALKYRSPRRQPAIHFKTAPSAEGTLLTIADNGLGINMELYKDKIFGLRKTFHIHKEAKGVGLFLTKTQVEAMGGKIWLDSEVDRGTTVSVLFK